MSDNYIYVGYETDDYYSYSVVVYDKDGNELNEAVSGIYTIDWITQSASSVYVYGYDGSDSVLRKYDKSGTDLNFQWDIVSNSSEDWTFAKNEDPIVNANHAGTSYIRRYDKTDGSQVWSTSYSSDYTGRGITVLSTGNIAIGIEDTANENHLIQEYDATSGEKVNEIPSQANTYPRAISRDLDDNYVVGSGSSLTKYDSQSGDVIWQLSLSIGDSSGVHWDGDNYYVHKQDGTYTGEIEKVDNSGSSLWNKEYKNLSNIAEPRPYGTGSNFLVHTYSDVELLDGDDGYAIWTINLSFPYESVPSISAYPQATAFPVEWGIRIEISGTVVDGGTGVSGAKVTVIDDTSDEVLTTTTTDADGNWSATVPDTRLHVVAQYEDDSGTVYNTTSYPFVNSQ
jgi:hypothetical protein